MSGMVNLDIFNALSKVTEVKIVFCKQSWSAVIVYICVAFAISFNPRLLFVVDKIIH